jgi:hypothetical protein
MTLNFIDINNIRLDSDVNFQSLDLFSRYYQEYYGEKFKELSFTVWKDDELLGHVQCSVLDGKLTLPDGGVIIQLDERKIPSKECKPLYTEILKHLQQLVQTHHCSTIVIKDHLNTSLSPLGEALFNLKFQSRLTFEMCIDYASFDREKFYSTLRKSYKSLINWGKRELEITYLNKDNPDFDSFMEFQKFHHKISGRKTRSDKSWEMQHQMIKEGIGELILAEYKGTLVAGSLFADYGDISMYFTGVYERDLFEYGVSHFLLYDGICRSFERKNTTGFSLGYFDTDIKDPKWYNIQFFKKGFCQTLKPIIFWSQDVYPVDPKD